MLGCTFAAGGDRRVCVQATPGFLARVRARARALQAGSRASSPRTVARESRGLGLLVAVETGRHGRRSTAPALVRACRDHGLLLVRGGERAVRLLPPLNVTRRVTTALDRLEAALTSLETSHPPPGECMMKPSNPKRVVLAYSAGSTPHHSPLVKRVRCEVICYCSDVGQGAELEGWRSAHDGWARRVSSRTCA